MSIIEQYMLFFLKIITIYLLFMVTKISMSFIKKKSNLNKFNIIFLNKYYYEIKIYFNLKIKNIKCKNKKFVYNKNIPSLYIIDFCGDIKARQVDQLRETITSILDIVRQGDEILLRLESPGGTVNGYGFAASQLQRIKERNIPLTICIDKIATSGGYLMACIADYIVASPFAIVGSIGVAIQIPNFYRWLEKNNIDVELLTAGEYKRTLTHCTKNTEKGKKKLQQDLDNIHLIFKKYVKENRKTIDIEKVSTGEFWLAKDAIDLNLVDRLQTSDDFIIDKMKSFNVFAVSIRDIKNIKEKFSKLFSILYEKLNLYIN